MSNLELFSKNFDVPSERIKKPRFQNLCLPVAAWPAVDQAIWSRAQNAVSRFDKDAPMAKLAPTTIRGREKTYGALLIYMSQHGMLNPELHPRDWLSVELMSNYVDYLSLRLRASSVHEEICRIRTSMGVFAPGINWSWIRRLPNAPTRAEIDASKKKINPPDPAIILHTSLKKFDEADEKPLAVKNLVDARNALIIAFAAFFALRRKNLQEIERGIHLIEDGSTMRLSFDETLKTPTSLLFDIPMWITEKFKKYLAVHRPMLLGKRRDHFGLWVSRRGTHLSSIAIGAIFHDFGTEKLGRQFNCHVMRHALANSIILRNPSDNDLAAAALGHTSTEMVDDVYTKSATMALSKIWQRKLKTRKRRLGVED